MEITNPDIPRDARTNGHVDLKAMGPDDLTAFVEAMGQPSYRGQQLFNWIYGKGVDDFAAMSNLPKAFRAELADVATVSRIEAKQVQQAQDQTIKALYALPSGRQIETVLIPSIDARGEARRLTVCVSSQVGCAMGCHFCATGLMGFRENLAAGHIFDQVWAMNELTHERFGKPISNIVYMGMGEPLLNYDNVLKSVALVTHEKSIGLSPRRITVSTVGLARRIRDLADDGVRFNLAVSLHAPTNETRSSIMPVNTSEKTSLPALKEALQHYAAETGREITYEYCLFKGVNDSTEDARRLATITRWAPSKVNIIMYNPVQGLNFERTSEEQLDRFIQALVAEGVTVTVRRSRGDDIDAACGQLAVNG